MRDALVVTALSLVPHHATARGMGRLAAVQAPRWLRRAMVRAFVRAYGVDLSEAMGSLDDYPSLAALFSRPLKPGSRPVDTHPDHLVSPVDGTLHSAGPLRDGALRQALGKWTRLSELLGVGRGVPHALAARFEGGSAAVLYLSPKDYHRVHTPERAQVAHVAYLPGRLWPVFPAATRTVDNLFADNERLVFFLDTPGGPLALVMVGAFGVGRMTTPLRGAATNQGHPASFEHTHGHPPFDRGAELGRFLLGSTVVLVAPAGAVEWLPQPGATLRQGRPLARWQTPD